MYICIAKNVTEETTMYLNKSEEIPNMKYFL